MGRPTIPLLPVFDQVNFQTLHSSSRQTDQFHVHNLKLRIFPKDDSYLETIKIDRYDLFVIISDACFSENDAWLARNILNRGKPFSLVRTKLDEAMTSASYDGHKMEEVIPRIYKSCKDNLRKASIREPKIFVISNYEHEIGQFDVR
jgi:hypothetical protein